MEECLVIHMIKLISQRRETLSVNIIKRNYLLLDYFLDIRIKQVPRYSLLYISVIPDDEYDPGPHDDSNYYYHDFIGDHTRIIGGSIVSIRLESI